MHTMLSKSNFLKAYHNVFRKKLDRIILLFSYRSVFFLNPGLSLARPIRYKDCNIESARVPRLMLQPIHPIYPFIEKFTSCLSYRNPPKRILFADGNVSFKRILAAARVPNTGIVSEVACFRKRTN